MFGTSDGWARFRELPEEVFARMPPHVRLAFAGAAAHDFEVEIVCPQARIDAAVRASRRLVIVADDLHVPATLRGPIAFDLSALAADVRFSRRSFIITATEDVEAYVAGYGHAVVDLSMGFDAAVIVETRSGFEQAWVNALSSLAQRDRSVSRYQEA